MLTVGSELFLDGAISEGSVTLDADGLVARIHEGDPTPDEPGLIVPAPCNAHTHIADIVARGQIEATSLEEVVAPPDGLKHRILARTPEVELVGGMVHAVREAAAAGVSRLIDFREGGPYGARLAREATTGEASAVTILGRPTAPDRWEDEADKLLPLVHGIGVSGLADQPSGISLAQADWCAAHARPLALHWAEGRHEGLDAALALEPALLVHATHASKADITRLADEPPVALCPRSNALFGNRPPLSELLAAGVELALGTDNAMFHSTDIWQEVAWVREQWPDVAAVDLLRMVTGARLRGEPRPALAVGERVVRVGNGDDLDTALRTGVVDVLWR